MPARDDARPATLMTKPSWLISEVSRLAHPLITDKLATVGSRGYHYRLLAALQEFGPASQAMLGRRTWLALVPYMVQRAWVGERRAARMAGSSPARAPMTKAAASPPAQASPGMTRSSRWPRA